MKDLTTAVDAISPRRAQVLEVLTHPNPRLTVPSQPVVIGPALALSAIQDTLNDMVATMQARRAVGLAAIQIGVPYRMLVVQDEQLKPVKVINPRVISTKGHSFTVEGCLSFPGLFLKVARPETVSIEYFDENLTKQTLEEGALLGRAIQHEMDHLDGKTFLDAVSSIERSGALRKLRIMARKVRALRKSLTAKGPERR